ncbi:MAG: acyl-CoA thioesterase [Planctomycetia bacterium]|nr:acyl-CoA thioesterase [Planctomycetia bacterium]
MTLEPHQSHLDVWGHTNNVCYIQWMQDVAVAHSAALGWDSKEYLSHNSMWVVRSHSIEYKHSSYLGDRIFVQTWIAEMRKVSCLRRYRFLKLPKEMDIPEVSSPCGFIARDALDKYSPELLASAETTWAFVSSDALKPIRVFSDLSALFDLSVEECRNRFRPKEF